MNYPQLFQGCAYFIMLHTLIWFSANGQFMKNSAFFEKHSLLFAILAGPIIGVLGYYGARYVYAALSQSVWAVRFVGFGLSYLIFPLLTWYLLGETMFTIKTMVCIALSFLIILIQVYF